ncbi:MAG: pseudouridine synthase [Verrucomicrobia bacterium]|nr:pseudouridine synthase [Verrucomicrobiota bacterium]
MRLDRFITQHTGRPEKEVLRLIRAGAVVVEGEEARENRHPVDEFTAVSVEGEALPCREALYVMLHKPAGYLSATSDDEHPTVITLIDHPLAGELHLAGRLDRASTGLLLLTNNGRWSKAVTEPGQGVAKRYLVETREVIGAEAAGKFAEGIYFAYEDLTTGPAELEVLGEREARLTIFEGRYHQVKRMFHAVGNRVTALHRESIGGLVLDAGLGPGAWRRLGGEEVALFRGARTDLD